MDQALVTGLDLLATSRSIERRVDRILGQYHGLSFRDLELMLALLNASEHELALSELADCLGVQPSEVHRQLAPLERIGIVSRVKDGADPRTTKAVLTDAGFVLARDAMTTAGEEIAEAFGDRWGVEQQSGLYVLFGESGNKA